jgi:5'-methylthioinosine phosphorylase
VTPSAGKQVTPGLGIIGGTGFDDLPGITISRREVVSTPFGEPSAELAFGRIADTEFVFLPRHGSDHRVPPHRINYRANAMALSDAGVKRIIAIAAVGAIAPAMTPGTIVVPHQIIDYTWGREHTLFDGISATTGHIDFADPYSPSLRDMLLEASRSAGVEVISRGVYAAVQGPRLETAAEIDRMDRDGADIVGMTGMPEAALARELEMEYATLAIVVNAAAGRSEAPITLDMIARNLEAGTGKVMKVLGEITT